MCFVRPDVVEEAGGGVCVENLLVGETTSRQLGRRDLQQLGDPAVVSKVLFLIEF